MPIIDTIHKNRDKILELAHHRGVLEIRVFGSVAREMENNKSDIDFLVSVNNQCDLFDLGALAMDIEDLLHRKVDIVTEQGLYPPLRAQILKEARPI